MSIGDRHRFASIAPYLPSAVRHSVAVIGGASEREWKNWGRRGVTGAGAFLGIRVTWPYYPGIIEIDSTAGEEGKPYFEGGTGGCGQKHLPIDVLMGARVLELS